MDPLAGKFPWQSPYVAFDNNPIFYTDPLGLESGGNKDGKGAPGQAEGGGKGNDIPPPYKTDGQTGRQVPWELGDKWYGEGGGGKYYQYNFSLKSDGSKHWKMIELHTAPVMQVKSNPNQYSSVGGVLGYDFFLNVKGDINYFYTAVTEDDHRGVHGVYTVSWTDEAGAGEVLQLKEIARDNAQKGLDMFIWFDAFKETVAVFSVTGPGAISTQTGKILRNRTLLKIASKRISAKVAAEAVKEVGHLTPWSQMTKAEARAFQHSYSRHAAELGLPNWMQTRAPELQGLFNNAVSNLRSAGSNGFFRSQELVKGAMTTVNRTEPIINGQRYFYYETLQGKFISAGKMP